MPTIDWILSSLQGAQVFSSLDLRSGHWQMMVHPGDVEKTAFVCHEGLFQFRVLPFGVVNGPASFQRLMSSVLGDLIGKTCYVVLDDIVCYSPSVSEHLQDLAEILTKLRQAGLTVNAAKCNHYMFLPLKPDPREWLVRSGQKTYFSMFTLHHSGSAGSAAWRDLAFLSPLIQLRARKSSWLTSLAVKH